NVQLRHGREHVANRLDELDRAHGVVVNVAEKYTVVVGDIGPLTPLECEHRIAQRPDGAAQLIDLPSDLGDPPGEIGTRSGQHFIFQIVDVLADLFEDGHVVVHDDIQQRVE